ncbi:hypothetical protein F511_36535 [Dorcoceras hygrometricum]|uniref:Uncharacterized protein n=1 Tax=Dorcoceras hygrometricum TaxID=472368 RepID=A0A2Z7C3K6_9LAMI|nr:hypothetical protein F511_36535 [Dorcoceras hygrometricum]
MLLVCPLDPFRHLIQIVSADSSSDDVMLYVGIEVADISFAAARAAASYDDVSGAMSFEFWLIELVLRSNSALHWILLHLTTELLLHQAGEPAWCSLRPGKHSAVLARTSPHCSSVDIFNCSSLDIPLLFQFGYLFVFSRQ